MQTAQSGLPEEGVPDRASDSPTSSSAEPLPTQVAFTAATEGGVIGPYHLLQKIAEGGMGEVWLAEQKRPVRRRVALKLIKHGMDSREIVLRFESERQALALMDHPAIAKVYDAGSTPQGTPYFAMEYVPGTPISDYCDQHKLSVRQRLDLFTHVCEGVQHAHQKAIIHRDLKPSNILVSEIDGRPVPKIIDFGVAKALSNSLTEQTMFTRVGSILGTPEYMSPEQASSGGEDIDTRTDVYSLGVILYELLAGVPPLDLKSSGYFDLVRKIREEKTPKPSTRVRNLSSAGEKTDKSSRSEQIIRSKELQGDLDCITMKCLEKDRNRRYGSPSELAADIHRYLQHLPVLATPPSAAYRLQKFAQRNRGLLAALCATLIVLVAGTAVSIYQAVRARKAERAAIVQRDRADSEASIAEAVTDFLQNDLLSQASADVQRNPDAEPDPDVRVRTLVDRSAAALSKKFAGKPMIEADLRKTLGETYLSLGLLKEAETQLQQAYDLSKSTRGPDAKQTIETLQSLGAVEFNNGQHAEAARHQQIAYESARRALGHQDPVTLTAMQSLAVDYMMLGDRQKAEPLLKTALAAQIKTLGYESSETLDTSDSLATLYITEGRFAEAQKLLENGLPYYEKMFGPEHPNTMREKFGLARVLFGTGQYAKAEEIAQSVYDSNRKLLGPSHFKTVAAGRMLARIQVENGKIPQAQALLVATHARSVAGAGNENMDTTATKEALAEVYERQNQYNKAEALRKEVVAVEGRQNGSPPDAAISLQLLGKDVLEEHRCEQAAEYLRTANARWKANKSPNWHRFQAQVLLGKALACQNKNTEAEPLLLSGLNGLKDNAAMLPAYEQGQIKDAADHLATVRAALKH